MSKLPRFAEWYIAAVVLVALLWVTRMPNVYIFLVGVQQPDGTIMGGFVPKDIIVLMVKAVTVVLGAITGWILDNSMFPYGRPDKLVTSPDKGEEPWPVGDAVAFSGSCIRRAIVVVGIAFAYGLSL